MAVRRVVTGHDGGGRSVFIEDSAVEPITTDLAPGFEAHEMWGLDDTATVPVADPPRATTSYYPPVNGVRFQVITIPPDGAATPEDLDLGAALEQLERAAPGITAYNETDDPGMHTTDTVDYVYIASGTSASKSTTAPRSSCTPGTRSFSRGTGTPGETVVTSRASSWARSSAPIVSARRTLTERCVSGS